METKYKAALGILGVLGIGAAAYWYFSGVAGWWPLRNEPQMAVEVKTTPVTTVNDLRIGVY